MNSGKWLHLLLRHILLLKIRRVRRFAAWVLVFTVGFSLDKTISCLLVLCNLLPRYRNCQTHCFSMLILTYYKTGYIIALIYKRCLMKLASYSCGLLIFAQKPCFCW